MANFLAICAAFLFALAAALQQKGAMGVEGLSLRKLGSLLRLVEQTWWLFGSLVLLGGYTLQAVALDHGRLAVIQPLLVTTIVFALPLGYFLTHQSVNRTQIAAAALVVVGLTLFTVVGDAAQGNEDAPSWEWAIVIVLLAILSGVLLKLGEEGSPARKAGYYGACAGLLYGLSAALWKPTGETLSSDGLGAMLGSWEFWAFAAAGVLAFVVQQLSLATGRLAPSVAMTSVLNPLVGILIGTLLLEERLADPAWHKLVAYGGLGLALLAATTITRTTEGAKEATSAEIGVAGVTGTA